MYMCNSFFFDNSDICNSAVIAKYAWHARHVRHDSEMSGREFKHCRTFCLAEVNVKEMSSRETYIKYLTESFLFAGHQVTKCPAGNQNVWQSTEYLPDILSSTPEIILAITDSAWQFLHVRKASSILSTYRPMATSTLNKNFSDFSRGYEKLLIQQITVALQLVTEH